MFPAILALPTLAGAWGPHTEITQAALNVLATNHPLVLRLGSDFQRLTKYSWLADYKRVPFPDANLDFYADDYLLFPTITNHLDHICPEVKKTYTPYFHRALQALRTEDAPNAARWVGSLLHFVEDTGSPPHAAEIRGGIHGKMENWVDAKLIHLGAYQPQLFGRTDEEALKGFLRRMDGLIDFSRERGRKIRVQVEIGNRSAVQPVVLESALETARVTADLLHTLGELAGHSFPGACSLRGVFNAKPGIGLERFPAKVILQNTNFSTLANVEGHFTFHHLPAGRYDVWAFRPGSAVIRTNVELHPDKPLELHLDAPTTNNGANLVRNGNFNLRWICPAAPDCWTRTPAGWEGEVIRLQDGQKYRLTANFKADVKGDLLLRWTRQLPYQVPNPAALPKIDSRPLTPEAPTLTFTGTPTMALLQITMRTPGTPDQLCDSVELVAEP